jgi:hypothetical protein
MMVPFTGLGLYGGFRGNHWLRNRVTVFKQFVVPSLLAQSNNNFTVWICWRRLERDNAIVKELIAWLRHSGLRCIHTFGGVPFWDDKYPDDVAYDRLIMTLHNSLMDLKADVGDAELVLMTIQPSDDCYYTGAVEQLQRFFNEFPEAQAMGFSRGYIAKYATKDIAEYNPKTNPPFFTIKFPRETFLDDLKHLKYTGPYKSHEYIGQFLNYFTSDIRGFLVGIHGENISTVFDHPYCGSNVSDSTWGNFGLQNIEKLKIKLHLGKRLLRKMPYRVQRKLRYWFGEKLMAKIYNIRNT